MRQIDCQDFRADIVHFQADELPAERRSALQAHLDKCAECARRLEVEDGLLRAIRAKLPRHEASDMARARVRAALRREASDRASAWWSRPSVLVAAAASLALAVFIVGELGRVPTEGWRSVERVVLVVDHACDLAGKSLADQRGCLHPMHANALKLDDGSYWSVSIDNDDGRRVVLDREMRGHRLRVRGDYIGRIRTLRLEDVRDMGITTLQSLARWLPLAASGFA